MKITIYVKGESVDNLQEYIQGGVYTIIKWHHARRTPKDVEVTIAYGDYMILKDLRDE